ncbi:hypothetical protein AALO_G00248340 [Alosa alosa]|uniref:GLTSCR protein conserved domain-containing protein n=1 Tax=Alosa alosa TaxID=278164 RepID=A0AAV6FT23_9TELE|nr:BRD4-interacting chromatin-remodeling complex-associated protein [Alosa alosa]KAG5265964.1 hypothetical protein AALO_G00248340 [Alosa alosa]
MEDEDGTCLLDVLCDPQALNDFLHGASELENEDLLISSASGEPPLFTDAPSPVSLLADDPNCQDAPAAGCVDLSFLEEALLESPEPRADDAGLEEEAQGGLLGPGCEEEPEEEPEEDGAACDILQQSLQEADITEQTLALEAGLAPPTDSSLSLYQPGALLPSPPVPYLTKPLTISTATSALPRDTQAVVEPPQPSLLAVGPGCPSLKPVAPQFMGLLPGHVFPAPSPETNFSLSPVQGSSMLIQKTVPSITGRPMLAPTVRANASTAAAAVAAPGILFQRGPLPIQPKLPVSIQPRLVQISPKPTAGQKPAQAGLTFVPGTTSSNILVTSPPVGPKQAAQSQPTTSLPKPVSLQLLNQAGSFVIQPRGLFQGQNQFLLPGQTPMTIAQPACTTQQLLTQASAQRHPSVQGGPPTAGPLVDSSQILTVPQRQLNFGPVFTTPSGQLALRQGTLLSGPLQLQSAPPAVFQVPAQLAGAYAPQGQGQHCPTVVHNPALGNHITLINSSAMLGPEMTSISIVNGPSVVQGLPFGPPAHRETAQPLRLPQASVLLLPERPVPEERPPEELLQLASSGQLVPPVPLHSSSMAAGMQPSSTPPVVTLLQPMPDTPQALELSASPLTSTLMHQPEIQHEKEGRQSPVNHIFIQHLQQQTLKPLIPCTDPLATSLPAQVTTYPSPQTSMVEAHPAPTPPPTLPPQAEPLTMTPERTAMAAPVHSGSSPSDMLSSPPPVQASLETCVSEFSVALNEHSSESLCGATGQISPQVSVVSAVCSSLSPLPIGGTEGPMQQQLVSHPAPEGLKPDAPQLSASAQHQIPHSIETAVPPVSSRDSREVFCPRPQRLQLLGTQGYNLCAQTSASLTPKTQESKTQMPVLQSFETEEPLTQAIRRHRIQLQVCSDHKAVLNPQPQHPFVTLEDAVRHLLPYHTCAGRFPSQKDFNSVDEQFEAASAFLFNCTKNMQNKYRQLLLAEAQQDSPSAEMVMLERLFLQSERFALGEERRKARRDPESFLMSLRKSSPHNKASSTPVSRGALVSPSSPPAWALHSDRPPGLKTYQSSSRGTLRLTIKHESGLRKVVHNSACEPANAAPSGHKRHYSRQLVNGGDKPSEEGHEGPSRTLFSGAVPQERSNGLQSSLPTPEVQLRPLHSNSVSLVRTALEPQLDEPPHKKHVSPKSLGPTITPPLPEPCGSRLKLTRLESPPAHLESPGPAPPPPPPHVPSLQEDNALSEHLQSAIDSILELQRLQGSSLGQARLPQGPGLEQPIGSMLQGRL